MKPRLLDLFCGAGGAAKGYQQAGFYVVGVDLRLQPRYCGDEFVQADAMTYPLDDFDAVHASPPCQSYSTMTNRFRSEAPKLIDWVRARFMAYRILWVIENVAGARRVMQGAFELTGEMFGLSTHRARLFESNVLMLTPEKPPRQEAPVAVYGKMDGRRLWTRKDGSEHRIAPSLEIAQQALDINWMVWDELKEAIPPAYTRWIGERLMEVLAIPRRRHRGAAPAL